MAPNVADYISGSSANQEDPRLFPRFFGSFAVLHFVSQGADRPKSHTLLLAALRAYVAPTLKVNVTKAAAMFNWSRRIRD